MNRNYWKKAFFALLIIQLLAVTAVVIMVFIPPKDAVPAMNTLKNTKGEAVFTIESNKKDLNLLINHYLEEENEDGVINYQVILSDHVQLTGELPVFSHTVQMQATFLPKALANGDLILTENSISIGQFQLPATYIMNLIKKSYRFPEWVEIFPNEQMIYLHLTDIPIKNDLRMEVKQFDLEADEISFVMKLPKKE